MAEGIIYPCVLAREINGTVEYLYPKTDAKLVTYDDKQNVKEKIDTMQAEVDLNTEYTRFTGSEIVEDIHGISKGETFDKTPVTTVLKKLLYPYISPEVSVQAFINGSSGAVSSRAYEIGSRQMLNKLRINITKKSNPIIKYEAFHDGRMIGSGNCLATDPVNTSGSAYYDINNINLQFGYDTTKSAVFTAEIHDADSHTTPDQGKHINKYSSPSYPFVYPYYYGTIPVGTPINATTVANITNKIIQTKGNKKCTFNAFDEILIFASPNSAIRTIIDQNNFNITDTFNEHIINGVVNQYGVSCTYYVYSTIDPTSCDNFNITFNH